MSTDKRARSVFRILGYQQTPKCLWGDKARAGKNQTLPVVFKAKRGLTLLEAGKAVNAEVSEFCGALYVMKEQR